MAISTQRHPHEEFLHEVRNELAEILDGSSQGIYIYLDDPHWFCNERLAQMLGYASAAEVKHASTHLPILEALVLPESHNSVVDAYLRAVNDKTASVVPVTWKKRDGSALQSRTIFVPIRLKGTTMAMHFVTPA